MKKGSYAQTYFDASSEAKSERKHAASSRSSSFQSASGAPKHAPWGYNATGVQRTIANSPRQQQTLQSARQRHTSRTAAAAAMAISMAKHAMNRSGSGGAAMLSGNRHFFPSGGGPHIIPLQNNSKPIAGADPYDDADGGTDRDGGGGDQTETEPQTDGDHTDGEATTATTPSTAGGAAAAHATPTRRRRLRQPQSAGTTTSLRRRAAANSAAAAGGSPPSLRTSRRPSSASSVGRPRSSSSSSSIAGAGVGAAAGGNSENITVYIRMRPLAPNEIAADERSVWSVVENGRELQSSVTEQFPEFEKTTTTAYPFEFIGDSNVTTSALYHARIRANVRAFVQSGVNSTVMAYGQTSSGKSYTMMGEAGKTAGISGLCLEDIFLMMAEPDTGRAYELAVSYFEIYNEEIYDLLANTTPTAAGASTPRSANSAAKSFRIRERRATSGAGDSLEVFIPGLTLHRVRSKAEVFDWIGRGMSERHIRGTNLNRESSRGHTILQLSLESYPAPAAADQKSNGAAATSGPKGRYRSVLNLVDLAGSERVNSLHTGADSPPKLSTVSTAPAAAVNTFGARSGSTSKLEGTHINKSLYFLTTVIKRLSLGGGGGGGGSGSVSGTAPSTPRAGLGGGTASGADDDVVSISNSVTSSRTNGTVTSTASTFIPYRNSKLTRILQPSLGGNARTVIICCITPAERHFAETVSTLKFAGLAQNVKNVVSTNVVVPTTASATATAIVSDRKTGGKRAAPTVATSRHANPTVNSATVATAAVTDAAVEPSTPLPLPGTFEEIESGLLASESLLGDWHGTSGGNGTDVTPWEECDRLLEQVTELGTDSSAESSGKAVQFLQELMTTVHRIEDRDTDKLVSLQRSTLAIRQLLHAYAHLSQQRATEQQLASNQIAQLVASYNQLSTQSAHVQSQVAAAAVAAAAVPVPGTEGQLLQSCQRDLRLATEEVLRVREENESLVKSNATLTLELSSLRVRMDQLDAENTEFTHQFAAAERRAEYSVRALQAATTRGMTNGLTEEWQSAVDQLCDAQSELDTTKRELTRCKARLATVEAERSSAQQKVLVTSLKERFAAAESSSTASTHGSGSGKPRIASKAEPSIVDISRADFPFDVDAKDEPVAGDDDADLTDMDDADLDADDTDDDAAAGDEKRSLSGGGERRALRPRLETVRRKSAFSKFLSVPTIAPVPHATSAAPAASTAAPPAVAVAVSIASLQPPAVAPEQPNLRLQHVAYPLSLNHPMAYTQPAATNGGGSGLLHAVSGSGTSEALHVRVQPSTVSLAGSSLF